MTTYRHEKFGVEFSLPESITVGQQLKFMSVLHDFKNNESQAETQYERQWKASLTLIQDWRCDWFPDPARADLNSAADDRRLLFVIMWASTRVFENVMGLDMLPKDGSDKSSIAPVMETTPLPN